MSGTNPYIPTPKIEKAQSKFSIEFRGADPSLNRVIELDPAALPSSGTGLPGSILDIALAADIEIDHACGGVCACSTCHVIVREGLATCNEAEEAEEDMLDKAPGLTAQSRLACQCVPNGKSRLVVEIPNWNRNLVREGH
jgi:2Fe-2S ferredoxin